MAVKKDRSVKRSSSVGVGIVCFLLGFLFAIIVLVGSIFGVGYVAATTDINEVLGIFGLQNKNDAYDESDPDSNKYNYINADQAPNIYALITEVMKLANEGLGEINFNKIDALAPVTTAVLDMAYGFIDDVVDFDKEYFEDVPLTSIIDSVKNSMYYVRVPKLIDILNEKMGYSVSLDSIPVANYVINGIEANYATVKGKDASFKLPVLFDYYVNDGSSIGYARTTADPAGTSAYPANFGDDYSYLYETSQKNSDGAQLYKVYYVPCKVTPTGIEEADYTIKKNAVEDPDVSFSKNGESVNLKYTFRTVEFGADTDFIAVKVKDVDGASVFELDYDQIIAAKNSDSSATASNRYVGYSYYESYARNYYKGPSARTENDRIFGVTTVNGINYFKKVDGTIMEYDPLVVSDVMLNAMQPLNSLPVYEVVNDSQKQVVKDMFGDTSLGDILNQNVNFNELINEIELTTFLKDVRYNDRVMTYIVYNLSDVTVSSTGNYSAIYDKGGENIPVILTVEDGFIRGVTNATTGDKVTGNTVADMNTLTNGLTVDVFMEVKATDAIMLYLAYGITDAQPVVGEDYDFVGEVDGRTAYIYVDSESGIVSRAVDQSGFEISGTKIENIGNRVNNITDALAITDFIDINVDEDIMAFIGYGLYDIKATAGENDGKQYTHIAKFKTSTSSVDAYIATEIKNGKTVISSAWWEGGRVLGTKIGNVASRLDDIADVMPITQFIKVDPTDAIMAYMGYGITSCTPESGADIIGNSYSYKAQCTVSGIKMSCYISVDSDGNIDEVWYNVWDGEYKKALVSGTKISEVPQMINGLQDNITIGEIITVDDSSSMILQAIKDSTIGGLNDRINELTLSDILTEDQINNNTVLPQLRDTSVLKLGEEIDKILIQRIYAKTVYGLAEDGDPTEATSFNAAYLYYQKDANGKFNLVTINCPAEVTDPTTELEYDNNLGKLTQSDWDNRGDNVYYTYGEAKGMWKLILYRVDGSSKTEKAYTLNNFNNMVNSCATSVYNSTLGELQDAGIISGTTNLNKYLKVATAYIGITSSGNVTLTPNQAEATPMANLTLKQLLDVVINYMGSDT